MTIRTANNGDIPNIVKVLKASLGEAELPFSEKIWRYKHEDNPFGKSLVLVAEESGEILGVRAFMRWQWQERNRKFSAFRAVDTATHPEQQGRGIFKKLTLQAVEAATNQGDHFVFNTPNEKSRPGYLKMGWEQVQNLKVVLIPQVNWSWFRKSHSKHEHFLEASEEEVETICRVWNETCLARNLLFTPKSQKYLNWRYEKNPLQDYEIYSGSGFYLAAHLKKRKGIRELRISELLYKDEKALPGIRRKIKHMYKKFGAHFISQSPDLIPVSPIHYQGTVGPILTVRRLDLPDAEYEKIKSLNSWYYSLGDMELF